MDGVVVGGDTIEPHSQPRPAAIAPACPLRWSACRAGPAVRQWRQSVPRYTVMAEVDERHGLSSLRYRTGPDRGVLPSNGGNDGQPQVSSVDVCVR